MADGYGTGYREPGTLDAIDTINRCAEIRAVNSTIYCGDGDEPGSRYFVGYVPTNGSIDTGSVMMWGDTGITRAQLGFKGNPAAFGEFDMSLEGGARIVDQEGAGREFGINDVDKRFWEHAKLARDEGGELDLVLTIMEGASVEDEKIKVVLKYFRQG